MNFNLILYIVVSIMLISGSFYLNFSNGKSTQAMILGVGFLLVSVIFGLRWFSSVFKAPTNDSMVWPPKINTCPDYLTLTKVSGVYVCVDTVGVSQQQDVLAKWTDANQTDAKYLFNLSLDKVGSERVSALCNSCKAAKITWEGVFDGDVCLNMEPPRPV
jgi:hypothetical protein